MALDREPGAIESLRELIRVHARRDGDVVMDSEIEVGLAGSAVVDGECCGNVEHKPLTTLDPGGVTDGSDEDAGGRDLAPEDRDEAAGEFQEFLDGHGWFL